MRPLPICWVFALSLVALPASAAVLKEEPPMGTLKPSERVLVDNGSCPRGQVLELIGGDHRKVGGKQMIERKRRCIAR